mmetsp:Transcript_6299/g.25576  ORF Transcript_6299/g.25576 Transcript_6299/m.25576 type:complete len:218 (+) Transcript_6299:1011-1664(+)
MYPTRSSSSRIASHRSTTARKRMKSSPISRTFGATSSVVSGSERSSAVDASSASPSSSSSPYAASASVYVSASLFASAVNSANRSSGSRARDTLIAIPPGLARGARAKGHRFNPITVSSSHLRVATSTSSSVGGGGSRSAAFAKVATPGRRPVPKSRARREKLGTERAVAKIDAGGRSRRALAGARVSLGARSGWILAPRATADANLTAIRAIARRI